MITIATACIVFGSKWSVTAAQKKKAKGEAVSKEDEEATHDDVHVSASEAAMFPFVGSAVLLSLYVCYKLFPRDMFNNLISFYFLVVSTYAVSAFLYPLIRVGILSGLIAIALSAGWWYTRHFAINNIIAVAICVTSLWKVKLPSFKVSWLLLWGLFVYDVWWVFGTEVMVSVARNIEAPVLIKLPKDFTKEYEAKNMVMLGLGDIVIPGFFVATCRRLDYHVAALGKKTGAGNFYFFTALFMYVMGLVTTIVVMLMFEHAQPALLYLVPWLTIGTLIPTLLFGSIGAFFGYDEDALSTPEQKQLAEKSKKEKEEEEASLSYAHSLYNLLVAELFFVEPYTGVTKAKKEN